MKPLPPEARAALEKAIREHYRGALPHGLIVASNEEAAFRAGCVWQMEQDAVRAWRAGMDEHERRGGLPHDCREVGSACASAIREQV